MDQKINVDINNLSADCSKLTDLIREIDILTKKITDSMGELKKMWEGIAQEQFINSFVSDISECVNMTDRLDFIRYAMQTALATYNNDSEEAVNIFLAADR